MNKNQDKGFTLVELLIVIVILGILATVTVFAVRGITTQGEENACATEKRAVEVAIEAFYADNNRTDPAVLGDLTGGNYLKTDPAYVTVDFTASPPTVSANAGIANC